MIFKTPRAKIIVKCARILIVADIHQSTCFWRFFSVR
jgi:hypothetical protein